MSNVDPVSSTQLLAVVKFWHAVGGLYIWEYFTTLDYEWRVIQRRLPYRWTIWIYSLSRFTALLSIILFFVTVNITTPINCQLWMLFSILFLCLSSIAATLLIVIRTIAIWNRNKVVVALVMTVWMISIGFHLYNLAQIRFMWNSLEQTCVPASNVPIELGFIPTIVADMVLFLIILTGLQGAIWLLLGSAIEIPSIVLTPLHLNDQLRGMFQIPSLITMTIAATRMHRCLIDFTSGSTEVTRENRSPSSLVFAKTKRTDLAPTSTHGRIEVSVNRASEQLSTGSKNDGDSSTGTVFSTAEKIPQFTGDPESV